MLIESLARCPECGKRLRFASECELVHYKSLATDRSAVTNLLVTDNWFHIYPLTPEQIDQMIDF